MAEDSRATRCTRGDIIAVVDTEKGAIEIEVFEDGVLDEIRVQPGEKVPVGTVLALIRRSDEAARRSRPGSCVAICRRRAPRRAHRRARRRLRVHSRAELGHRPRVGAGHRRRRRDLARRRRACGASASDCGCRGGSDASAAASAAAPRRRRGAHAAGDRRRHGAVEARDPALLPGRHGRHAARAGMADRGERAAFDRVACCRPCS